MAHVEYNEIQHLSPGYLANFNFAFCSLPISGVRPTGSAAEMKRAANKYVFKETAVPSDFNFFPKTATFKPLSENVPR